MRSPTAAAAVVLLALGHVFSSEAFSLLPCRKWRPSTLIINDDQYSKHGMLTIAMAPPVTQVDVNRDSKAKDDDDEILLEGDVNKNVDDVTPAPTMRQLPSNWLGEKLYILSTAALIGILTGSNIALFKTSVEFVREALYGDGIILPFLNPFLWDELKGADVLIFSLTISEILPVWLIPAVGGILVGILLRIGDMPPGLRDSVREVDLDSIRAANATPPDELLVCTKYLPPASQRNDIGRFSRKALAATFTLGTGNRYVTSSYC